MAKPKPFSHNSARSIAANLIALLALSFVLPGTPKGAQADSAVELKAETGTPAPNPKETAPGLFMGALDQYHALLQSRVNQPVLWFDGFFGDPRTDDQDRPETFVRLASTSRYTEGEGLTYPIRLRANIKLPRASERLRLILSGVNEDELRRRETGDDSQDNTTSLQREDGSTTLLGLRYTLYTTLRSLFNFGIGLNLDWPIESYARMHYRRYVHLSQNSLVRFTQTGFYNTIIGPGATSRLDVERSLPYGLAGRASLFGTYSKESNGLEWGAETSLYRQFSPRTALSLDLGAYGETRPRQRITTYRIGTRMRQSFLRPWLFFELEPEVSFPLLEDGKRQAVGAIALMLEIQFSSEKKSAGE